ncbi:5-formyltetrahydrofolate cyclo-ligase [Calidifontibacillus oryziterrae]|uniref:5-formyltetrahydrofolate cyclo-ligase n=1 Tax=Calidifontibacillus oryziterrae TaxID=1191699 RepID=UPI00030C9B80|nr:5-formyltetrahydrofolate cyclo-ligase [Calidifontibacillus oryziterrae]
MQKQLLRKMMKEKIENMTEDLYKAWSDKIANSLYSLNEWKDAETVGITISRDKEVYTRSIIEKGWELHKKIAIPKCDPVGREMTFRIIESFEQLEVVYSQLEEPIEDKTTMVIPQELDLLIVPGLAFTTKGHRLGFGGGYYDRFLSKYKGKTISLAFDLQLIDAIPMEDHDRTIGMIITNEQVILCT